MNGHKTFPFLRLHFHKLNVIFDTSFSSAIKIEIRGTINPIFILSLAHRNGPSVLYLWICDTLENQHRSDVQLSERLSPTEGHLKNPSDHHSTIVMRGTRETLKWDPITLRDASFLELFHPNNEEWKQVLPTRKLSPRGVMQHLQHKWCNDSRNKIMYLQKQRALSRLRICSIPPFFSTVAALKDLRMSWNRWQYFFNFRNNYR